MRNAAYISDYHIHSSCSFDAKHSMAEMVKSAMEQGVDELCFTDHVEPLEESRLRTRTPEHDWAKHLAQYEEAKAVSDGRIRVRLGAELGEITMTDTAIGDHLLETAPPLDFVIGSVHAVKLHGEVTDLMWLKGRGESVWREAIGLYLDEVRRLIDWGRFNVLGHLTLPLRYAKKDRGMENLSFAPYRDEVADILERLIDKGLGIELNTNRGANPLPDEPWLRLYRDLGGEIITMGSDAHTPEFIGCAMEECQELLRACSFRCFTTFEAQQPIFHKL